MIEENVSQKFRVKNVYETKIISFKKPTRMN